MGLISIVTSALKYVPWGKVADAAITYAPELLAKIKEKIGPVNSAPTEMANVTAENDLLNDRITELEGVVKRQNETISQLTRKVALLDDRQISLHSRMVMLSTITGITTVISIGLLFKIFAF